MQRQTSRDRRSAFTIIEVIVIVIILGVLAAVIAPRIIGRIGQSKQTVAYTNATTLMGTLKIMQADGWTPESGASITILRERPSGMSEGSWRGPYVETDEALKDPWGNYFVIVVPGIVNVDFDVVSYGADGQPGGEGDNADITAGKKP